MLGLTLLAIVVAGALGFSKRIPYWLSAAIVGILTVGGVATSPDISTRLLYLGAAALGPLTPYLLLVAKSLTIRPLVHYLKWRADSHRTCFDVGPDHEHHKAASEQIYAHATAFVALGFKSRGRIGIRVGKNVVVNEYLDYGDGLAWAVVSATIPPEVQPLVLQCSCRFDDGETLLVSNYQFVDPSDPAPGYTSVRLPSIDNAADLSRALDLVAARSSHGPVVATPLDTDLLTRAKDRTKARFEADVKAGRLRFDKVRDVYRSTLWGAYRLFWFAFPPLRPILEHRDRASEKALLKELGITPRKTATDEENGKSRFWLWAEAAVLIVLMVALAGWGPELLAMIGGREVKLKPNVTVPVGFTIPDSFPGAVRAFEQWVGQPSHQLSGTKDDEPWPTVGVAISMRSDVAAALVAAGQDAFLARGFLLFRTGERYSGLDTDGLALWPTADPYEVMRAMDTNAANRGKLVEDVIAWFRRNEARYPIRFTAIGFDYAGGMLGGSLPDLKDYARRFLQFCPDLQGEGLTSRSLANDLRRTREIFCWWD